MRWFMELTDHYEILMIGAVLMLVSADGLASNLMCATSARCRVACSLPSVRPSSDRCISRVTLPAHRPRQAVHGAVCTRVKQFVTVLFEVCHQAGKQLI